MNYETDYEELEEECFDTLKQRFPSIEIDDSAHVQPEEFIQEKKYILMNRQKIYKPIGYHRTWHYKAEIVRYFSVLNEGGYLFGNPDGICRYKVIHSVSFQTEKYYVYNYTEDFACK